MILSNLRLGGSTVDLRIVDGLIAEIGTIGTGDVDFDGRWVSPGLWDHHVHFTQWTLTSQRVDVSAAASAHDAALIIGGAIEPDSSLVIGAGYRDSLWPDVANFGVLDAVSGSAAVVIVSGDLHAVWLNSTALERFGRAGHPTGLLTEDDAFEVEKQLGIMPDATIDKWARRASSTAASRGLVGITDLEMAWNLGDWTRRIEAGHDALRVEFAVYTQHLDRAIAEGLRTGQSFGELLTMGRFKVLSDGSLNTRTAYTHGEYPDGGRGQLTLPPEQLVPLMRKSSAAGILPDVHAIGDHANTLALDAFETVGGGGRIEHAQLLSESDYARFAALGVEASVQPEHAMDDRDVAGLLWAGRTDRCYPFRSLIDARATLRFGSDAPVSPLDPWLGISAAVSRARDGREPWHPEQRISNAEALAASTRNTLEIGQPADLVVTELDPFTASGDDLRRMPVAATLLAGRFTYGG